MSVELANKTPAFQLKASLYTLTTLHLLESDLVALNEQLAKLRHQAPKFFNSAPVIIDLQRINVEGTQQNLDFQKLKETLTYHQLIIVGLRHVPENWHVDAKNHGFAILPNATQGKSSGAHSRELGAAKPLQAKEDMANISGKHPSSISTPVKSDITQPAPKAEPVTAEPTPIAVNQEKMAAIQNTLVISHPVRSGQQIYAKDADLVIISSVSPGAEVIADGNIHIYGQLKGRAIAGAKGNKNARIFCQQVGAELISIAGNYWTHEDVATNLRGRSSVQFFLKDGKLQLAKL